MTAAYMTQDLWHMKYSCQMKENNCMDAQEVWRSELQRYFHPCSDCWETADPQNFHLKKGNKKQPKSQWHYFCDQIKYSHWRLLRKFHKSSHKPPKFISKFLTLRFWVYLCPLSFTRPWPWVGRFCAILKDPMPISTSGSFTMESKTDMPRIFKVYFCCKHFCCCRVLQTLFS